MENKLWISAILSQTFLPKTKIALGYCSLWGKKVVRPAGGQMGENCYTFVYEILHIYESYALVVPFGGHITIACIVFS